MTSARDAFEAAWPLGPSVSPTAPAKETIWQVGSIIDSLLDAIRGDLTGKWIPFATKVVMNASLAYSADTEARVYNDGVNNGVYKKVGTSGAGSWTYIGPIPESDNTSLTTAVTALQALGFSGEAAAATYEGILYKLFGPGNAAALTSQGFWHNLVDSVAPRGELIADQVIDGKTYALALVDNSGQLIAGILKAGFSEATPVEIPGLVEVAGPDDTYAGGLTYKDGTGLILGRRNGLKADVRGWRSSTGLGTVVHFPVIGQSNAAGVQPVITTDDQKHGALMFRRGYWTWRDTDIDFPDQSNKGAAAFELVPFREQTYLATGETFCSGLTAQIKTVRAGGRNAGIDLTQTAPFPLFSFPGYGGRFLYELGPDADAQYGHWSRAINDISQARLQANAAGLDYVVGGIVFAQGEAESKGQMRRGGPFLGYDALVSAYKAQLADYWARWGVEFRLQSGQIENHSRLVPMFIVQTVSNWTGEAQRQVTQQYHDIFVACPMYFLSLIHI